MPCSPRVPSPDVFGYRPVVHAERFGMGRCSKTFTQADQTVLERFLDLCARFLIALRTIMDRASGGKTASGSAEISMTPKRWQGSESRPGIAMKTSTPILVKWGIPQTWPLALEVGPSH